MDDFKNIDLELYKLLIESVQNGKTGLMKGHNSITNEPCSVLCVMYKNEHNETTYLPIAQLYSEINPQDIYSPDLQKTTH